MAHLLDVYYLMISELLDTPWELFIFATDTLMIAAKVKEIVTRLSAVVPLIEWVYYTNIVSCTNIHI